MEMEQTYLEVLVARKKNNLATLLKFGCGVLAVPTLLMMPFSVFFLGMAVVLAGLAYFGYLNEWIEYEYSYVCRELSVDKIMARSRRKSVATYMVDKMEIGAPEGSHRLDGYGGGKYEVKDYSSKSGSTYVFYYEGRKKIVLEADQGLMEALHSASPSKLFLN